MNALERIRAAAQDRCAIARIQPDECWHLMEDR